MTLLQNLRGLGCNSPIKTHQRHNKVSLMTTFASNITGFAKPYGPNSRVSYSSLNVLQRSLLAFHVIWKWVREVFLVQYMPSPKPEASIISLYFLLVVGGTKYNNLFFTLEKICWHIPDHGLLKTWMTVPKNKHGSSLNLC